MDETAYWNRFYQEAHPELSTPSSFAVQTAERIAKQGLGPRLVELGCGNGRDALYFAQQKLRVFACDLSTTAIQGLTHLVQRSWQDSNESRPTFVVADMTALAHQQFGPIDIAYSRFTLHAVSRAQANATVHWAARNLVPKGRLFIEVRSILGSLYGKGTPVEGDPDAYIHDGHYRRFVRRGDLRAELESQGLVIRELVEEDGLSICQGDDPVVIRVDAEKPG